VKVRFIAVICTMLLLGSAMWSINSTMSMQPIAQAQADFSCDDVSEIPESECEVLVRIYKVSPTAGWEGWLTTNTPCSWGNVTCSDRNVTGLFLADKQLTSLPAKIVNLTSLTTLSLGENYLQHKLA